MKKVDKITCLQKAAGTYHLCGCIFDYNDDCCYYYILEYSDKLLLAIEEDDFILNGFMVRKLSDLQKLEIKDNVCAQINRKNRLLDNVLKPEINLDSWKSVLESLALSEQFLIIENEKNGDDFFYIGRIKEIRKSDVLFSYFDADGIWCGDVEIPYSKITGITFGDRYSKTWQQYFSDQ